MSSCATSGSPVAIAPDLPDVPAHLRQYCDDPGVSTIQSVKQAIDNLGANRLYAACERRKHRDALSFYDSVKKRFSPR